jgi:hypothetical protein
VCLTRQFGAWRGRVAPWCGPSQRARAAPRQRAERGGAARRFSDNAFTLLPWQNKTVQFIGEGPFSLADLQRSLSVLSIADTLPTPTLHTIGLPNMPARPRRPCPAPGLPLASSHRTRTLPHEHLSRGVIGGRPLVLKHADPRCTVGSPAPVARRARSTAACAAPVWRACLQRLVDRSA